MPKLLELEGFDAVAVNAYLKEALTEEQYGRLQRLRLAYQGAPQHEEK